MDPTAPPLRTATRLLQQALEHRERNPRYGPAPVGYDWVLPDLARLLVRHRDAPTAEVARHVRHLIDEQTFYEDAGDPVVDPGVDAEAQAMVELSLQAHRALHHGVANRPEDPLRVGVPPLMCG
jgi:hypothetical protein